MSVVVFESQNMLLLLLSAITRHVFSHSVAMSSV